MTDDSTATSTATVEVERFRAAAAGSRVEDMRDVGDVGDGPDVGTGRRRWWRLGVLRR